MTIQCGPTCEWVFSRVRVFPLVRGNTQVEWEVHPQFNDPGPYTFQVQVGQTGNPYADDWEDVGVPVVDTYMTSDAQQRAFGMMSWTHYRVIMTTSVGSYASRPEKVLGDFNHVDWTRIRALTRQLDLRMRNKAGVEGYLLKRKIYGERCSCVDLGTDEPRIPNCPLCYATGITGGYYDPYPCFQVEFPKRATRSHVSDTGTTNDGPVIQGRMINNPMLHSYDVWVDRSSDQRWIIHNIESEVEVRGVPIILYPVQMRLAPFTHIIYSFPIAGQQEH